jgi:hypothetical protein
MSSWTFSYSLSGTPVGAEVSFRNVTGNAVASVSRGDGQTPLAGVFRFTFEASNSVSIRAVEGGDLKSPNLFVGTRNVVTGSNTNLIDGLNIVLNPGISSGEVFEIGTGAYFDASCNLWRRVSALGLSLPGLAGSDRYVTVQNTSGQDMSNSLVFVTNGARIVNSVDATNPLKGFCQTGTLNPLPDADLSGAEITFDNYIEDTVNTVDILIDGNPIDVIDLTNNLLLVNGHNLSCDGTTVYRFGDGTKYQSCTFKLSSDLNPASSCRIYVSDAAVTEFYDPTTGAYVSGTTGIYLTAENCGVGVVPNGQSVDFRIRTNPSDDATTELNQRIFSLRVNSQGV